jgi:hypothetical protein
MRRQWTKKKAFNGGIGCGHLMVVVGFSGKDGHQQGGGKVAGKNRQGHRRYNQIEVTVMVAVAAAAGALNGSDGHGRGVDSVMSRIIVL